MKLAFLLSGRHPEIGEWEIRQLCRSYGVEGEFKRIDRVFILETDVLPAFFNRLALTHEVVRIYDFVEKSRINELNLNVNPEYTACVRVKKVGFHQENSEEVERSLGIKLFRRGVKINLKSPEITVRVYLVENYAIAGELIFRAEKKSFQKRAPKNRPFFFPGVILPNIARALVNLTATLPEKRLLDPMCGTGSFLIEAELMGIKTIGMDILKKMVRGSKLNLSYCGCESNLVQGDASRMPFKSDAFDAVVTDFPYGRSTKIVGEEREKLYRGVIEESLRVTKPGTFSVFVSMENIEEFLEGKFKLVKKFEDRVHKSLTRKIYLVKK